MLNISLFAGFRTFWVVQDFFQQPYHFPRFAEAAALGDVHCSHQPAIFKTSLYEKCYWTNISKQCTYTFLAAYTSNPIPLNNQYLCFFLAINQDLISHFHNFWKHQVIHFLTRSVTASSDSSRLGCQRFWSGWLETAYVLNMWTTWDPGPVSPKPKSIINK